MCMFEQGINILTTLPKYAWLWCDSVPVSVTVKSQEDNSYILPWYYLCILDFLLPIFDIFIKNVDKLCCCNLSCRSFSLKMPTSCAVATCKNIHSKSGQVHVFHFPKKWKIKKSSAQEEIVIQFWIEFFVILWKFRVYPQ